MLLTDKLKHTSEIMHIAVILQSIICIASMSLCYLCLRGYTPTQAAERKGHRLGKSVAFM